MQVPGFDGGGLDGVGAEEVHMLQLVQHPHVVEILDVLVCSERFSLVLKDHGSSMDLHPMRHCIGLGGPLLAELA